MIRKNNRRLYESIMRDVARAVKRHLNEEISVPIDIKKLKYFIKTNIRQQLNNMDTRPFVIHYKNEEERNKILNIINDTVQQRQLIEDTEVIDMSDYTNTKDFIHLIQSFADNDDLLLIFDLNTKIPGSIFNMLFKVIFNKMLGDTQEIQFKAICLMDDTSDIDQTNIQISKCFHFNLID